MRVPIGKRLAHVRRDPIRRGARQFTAKEPPDRTFHPAQQMDAIGNMTDGDLLDRFVRVKTMPHVTADASMQFADRVGGPRNFQRQDRHAERFALVLRVDAAEFQDLGKIHAQFSPESMHAVVEKIRTKPVVARFDGRMRGKNAFGPSLS